jgi:lipid-binding SYLF domain-containing protein
MTRPLIFLLSLIIAGSMATAGAATKLDRKVAAATEVIEQLSRIPEQGIPPSLLNSAYAVAVVPNVIEAGFVFGGSYGEGILVVRRPDGRWSNPTFIHMGSGSFGWQIGAQSSDIILVFKTRRGVDNIERGKLTLGGDIAVAAGPVGRQASASTDLLLKAEIYSYSRSRGLFGGISLQGSVIRIDNKANYAYYQDGQGSAARILADDHIPTPVQARKFIETLSARAPRLEWQEQSKSAAISRTPAKARPQPASETRTFSIDEAPDAGSDAIF